MKDKTVPVAMREGEIPVPIPNTTVKTFAADGTMLETAWESRRLPGLFYDNGLQAAKFESSLLEFKLGHLEA